MLFVEWRKYGSFQEQLETGPTSGSGVYSEYLRRASLSTEAGWTTRWWAPQYDPALDALIRHIKGGKGLASLS
jgi:hypothetical protein